MNYVHEVKSKNKIYSSEFQHDLSSKVIQRVMELVQSKVIDPATALKLLEVTKSDKDEDVSPLSDPQDSKRKREAEDPIQKIHDFDGIKDSPPTKDPKCMEPRQNRN